MNDIPNPEEITVVESFCTSNMGKTNMGKTILVIKSDDVSDELIKKIRTELNEAIAANRMPILAVSNNDSVYSVFVTPEQVAAKPSLWTRFMDLFK